MNSKTFLIFFLVFASFLNAKVCKQYVTSDSVFFSSPLAVPVSTSPKPLPVNCWGPCEMFIWGAWGTKLLTAQNTCLGLMGPISALGPLGLFGPLGDKSWNVEPIMKMMGNWEQFKKILGENGPLDSVAGPMSAAGPLGDSFFTTMPNINDFTKHMQGLGIWSVLGPLGPLGALGPLGPLGPLGAHGFGRTKDGDYVDTSKKIVNSVRATWNSTHAIDWPLYENYSKQRALALSKNFELDTSFMVSAASVGINTPDVYRFTSEPKQILTILVVPEAANQLFELTLKNAKGEVIAEAKHTNYFQSWIQVKLDSKNAAEQLQVEVEGRGLNCNLFGGCDGGYRLFVTGSTSWMMRKPHIAYSGDYIMDC